MKPIRLITPALFGAGICLTLFGCNGSSTGSGAEGTMHFTVNGTAYVASGNSGSFSHGGTFAIYSGHYHSLSVIGVISDAAGLRYVSVSFSDVTDTGTANIGDAVPATLFYVDSTQAGVTRKFSSAFLFGPNLLETGTLTKFDLGEGRASGTFGARLVQIYPTGAIDSVLLTGGTFTDVPITVN